MIKDYMYIMSVLGVNIFEKNYGHKKKTRNKGFKITTD